MVRRSRRSWQLGITAVALALMMGPACGDDDNGPLIDTGPVDTGVTDGPVVDRGPGAETGVQDTGAVDAGVDAAAAVQEVACGSVTVDNEVSMQNIAFVPVSTTISAGQVVRWTNNDSEPHTVTSGNPGEAGAGSLFDSGTLASGATYCLRFNQVATVIYFCAVHPVQMRDASVVVQ